jgi:hypothetical protein
VGNIITVHGTFARTATAATEALPCWRSESAFIRNLTRAVGSDFPRLIAAAIVRESGFKPETALDRAARDRDLEPWLGTHAARSGAVPEAAWTAPEAQRLEAGVKYRYQAVPSSDGRHAIARPVECLCDALEWGVAKW